MEEDAGKLLHEGFAWSAEKSGVDFNRGGVPLIEIVSEPDLRSAGRGARLPDRAAAPILLYAGVSDVQHGGGLAALRRERLGAPARARRRSGTRVEIKNLNSFRNVARAIEHEIARQVGARSSPAGAVVQETRLWNAERGETASMRSKEEAHDYRYFPEPDLPPLVVDARVDRGGPARRCPSCPRRSGGASWPSTALPDYDAGVLTLAREVADYFEAVARESGNAKAASNWVMTEVLRKLQGRTTRRSRVPGRRRAPGRARSG